MKDTITKRELNKCLVDADNLGNYDDVQALAQIARNEETANNEYLLTEEQQLLVDFYL